ncbi:MAG: hypothetical protein IKF64_05515 [Eubacterium sp.]|nr:hypothetical protein [Eubacterium sp.]
MTLKKKIKKNRYKILLVFVIILIGAIIGGIYYSNVVKTSERYEEARQLYKESSYSEAKEIFEELGDYKDCEKYVKDCEKKITEGTYNKSYSMYEQGNYLNSMSTITNVPDIFGATDLYEKSKFYYLEEMKKCNNNTINNAYYEIATSFYDKYNFGLVVKEERGDEVESYKVNNVCLITMIDFNNDGVRELVIGAVNPEKDDTAHYYIYTYSNGKAVQIREGLYVKRAGKNGFCTLDFFNDKKDKQIYQGDLHSGYTLGFDSKSFNQKLSWEKKGNGKHAKCTVNGKKVTTTEFDNTIPNYDEEKLYADGKKPFNSYVQYIGNFEIYSSDYLTETAAKELNNMNNNVYTILSVAHEKINSKK